MRDLYVLTLLVLFCSTAVAQTEFKIITLQHRFAHDVLPVIQPMVGAEGKVSAIDSHLFITATPDNMQAIEQIIATLDVERKNLRITISHSDIMQGQLDRTAISGRSRIGNTQIEAGKHLPAGARNGVELDIDRSSSNSSTQGSEFVTVLDGEQAFIRVGQSVPYTQQWLSLTQRYAVAHTTTEFREITTGFSVRPHYSGEQIELEIAPRIAGLDAGIVDFAELATVVRVMPGQWFDLGGNMQSRDDVSRAILDNQQGNAGRSTKLMIKVD